MHDYTNFPNLDIRQSWFSQSKKESEKGTELLDGVNLLEGALKFLLFLLRGKTVCVYVCVFQRMVWNIAHRREMAAQEIGTETAYHTQKLSPQTVSASFPSFILSPNKVVWKRWEMVKGLVPERNRTQCG